MVLLEVDAAAGAVLHREHQTGCQTRVRHPRAVVVGAVLVVGAAAALLLFVLAHDDGEAQLRSTPFLNRSAAMQDAAYRDSRRALNAFKTASTVSIFGVAMVGGFTPYVVARRRGPSSTGEQQSRREGTRQAWCDPQSVLPVLNTASAGIFLAAGLMHLLADAISNEELSDMSRNFWGDEAGSLHAIALCVSGLVLLVGIEQAGHAPRPKGCRSCNDVERGAYHEVVQGLVGASNRGWRGDSMSLELPPERLESDEGDIVVRNSSRSFDETQPPADGRAIVAPRSSGVAALMIGVALSVHSVLEGLALGAQEDIEQSLGIFVAILAHKGVAAFALGSKVVSYMQQMHPVADFDWALSFVACMTIFSVATPLGVAFAWGVTSIAAEDAEENPWSAVFSAVGAGTFLYVATIEVIPKELAVDATNRGIKFLALVAGAVVMGALALWI